MLPEELPADVKRQVEDLLRAKDASGAPLYSRAEVEDFATEWLLDALGANPELELPEAALALLDRFGGRIGIPTHVDGATALRLAREYFRAYPPPQQLRAALAELGRELSLTLTTPSPQREQRARALLGLLGGGDPRSAMAAPTGAAEPPRGGVTLRRK